MIVFSIVLWNVPITQYLLVQGYYQAKVIIDRKPIDRILDDPKTSAYMKDRLALVSEIKKFGIDLGLNNSKSYTSIYDTSGQPVAYVVSASYKDRLQGVEWNFPIVGRMPYLGFFKKDMAEKEFKKLKARGFDVLMRPVSAYSTTGILPDPLCTSLLFGSEEGLANTILHEMTHETIFIKNDMAFNESVASFIGNQGGIDFLKMKYGDNCRQLIDSANYKHDDEIFSGFMADLYDELDAFYRSPISSEEKIKGREKIFEKAKQDYVTKIRPLLRTNSFDYFPHLHLNNAYILYNRGYHRDYNIFEDLYSLQGSNLKKTIAFLKKIKNDPYYKDRIAEEVKRLKK